MIVVRRGDRERARDGGCGVHRYPPGTVVLLGAAPWKWRRVVLVAALLTAAAIVAAFVF